MKKSQSNSNYIVTILLVILAAVVVIWITLKPLISPGPATEAPATEPITPPTEQPQLIDVVVTEIAACYFGPLLEYQISISEHVIVGILERNRTNDLVQVRLNEKINCWMPLSSLELNDQSLDPVPFALAAPTLPATPVTPTLDPLTATSFPSSPLMIRWKIMDYDCGNGRRATGATVGLDVSDVSGGITDYRSSPSVPIYAIPGQRLTITVNSNTDDGQPAGIIDFTVPEANDGNVYDCKRTGNVEVHSNPAPQPQTEVPQPTERICHDKKGNVIDCDKK